MSETNGNGVWKNIALFLAGMVLSGAGWMITQMRDSISRAEVDEKIREVYATMDRRDQNLSDRLSRMEQTESQTGQDIARIAGRLGVSAIPVTPH